MIEKEKFARDVYTYLADKYSTPIFVNIAMTEQNHMDTVMQLIEKYGLNIILGDYGEFNNEHIQKLYDRAFVSTPENMYGVRYEPQVLSQEKREQIISSSMETGNPGYGHGLSQ